MEELLYLMGAFIGFFVFIFVVAVLCIVLQGYALYKMAKNCGVKYPWLAFFPYGSNYVMLNIPNKTFNLFNFYVESDRVKLSLFYIIFTTLGSFVFSILSYIPFIGFLFSLAYVVLNILITYRITKDLYDVYSNDRTKLFAILSLFVPFMQLVLLWKYKDHPPIGRNNTNYYEQNDYSSMNDDQYSL